MTEREFIKRFEETKENFISQYSFEANQKKLLDMFEQWVKGNDIQVRFDRGTSKRVKVDLIKKINNITDIACEILDRQGIYHKIISLGKDLVVKGKSRCIQISKDSGVYFRIGKTTPRKGRYTGIDLLFMEMVMDGNKKNYYLPMLGYVGDIESQVGYRIEREVQGLETSGKYRLKMYFQINQNGYTELSDMQLGEILARFIAAGKRHLDKINSK